MDVQAMGESDRRPFADIRRDFVGIDIGLQLVGRQHHQHVAPGGGFGDGHHLQAGGFGFGPAGAIGTQCHGDVGDAAVFQVIGVSVALAAVTDDHDFFGLDQVHVGVAIVINPHGGVSL